MTRCPMKFNNPYPSDDRQCERSECAWWLERFQMCAIAFQAHTDRLRMEAATERIIPHMVVASKRTG